MDKLSELEEKKQILIVEDEWLVAFNLQKTLESLGYTIAGVSSSGEDAVRLAESTDPDLILMDIRIQGAMDGIDAAEAISRNKEIPIIFMTAFADDATFNRAIQTTPYGYITKPFQTLQLKNSIEIALKQKNKLQEAETKTSEWMSAVQNVMEGAISLDAQGKILFLNHAAENFLGVLSKESEGKSLSEVFNAKKTDGITAIDLLESREETEDFIPAILSRHDGQSIPIGYRVVINEDSNYRILGKIITFSDLSHLELSEENRAAMEKILQSQIRIESVQKLAAGLAHEVNNPLMGILNYGYIIKNSAEASQKLKDHAEIIIQQAERVSAIIRSLILFSEQDSEMPSSSLPSDIVSSARKLMNELWGQNEVEMILENSIDERVFVRKNQMVEVLYNILYYLTEKMKGISGKKELRLTASTVVTSNGQRGLEVKIRTNRSMSLNTENLFEPFQVIQSNDTRIGLALSVCYGIVRSNQGSISLEFIDEKPQFIIQIPSSE